MKPNDVERIFELDGTEREALGLSEDEATWPIDNPVELLDLAQTRHEGISTTDLSHLYGGAARNAALAKQNRHAGSLGKLIRELMPYLPSAADEAEEFLRQEQ